MLTFVTIGSERVNEVTTVFQVALNFDHQVVHPREDR